MNIKQANIPVVSAKWQVVRFSPFFRSFYFEYFHHLLKANKNTSMLFNKKEPSFIVCLSWLATFAHVCVYIGTYGHVHHQCVFWYFPEAPILLSILSFKIILNNNNYVFYKLDFNAVSRVKPRHFNIIQLWSYLTNSHVHLFHNGTIGKQRLGQEQ